MSNNLNTNAILNQLYLLLNQQSRRTQDNYQSQENQENRQNNGYGNTYNDHIRRQQHLISDLLEDYNHQINNYTRNIERIIDLIRLLQNNLDNQLTQNTRMTNTNTTANTIPNINTNTNTRPNLRYNYTNQNRTNNNLNNSNNRRLRDANTVHRYNYNIIYPIEFEWLMRNTRANLTSEQIELSTEDIIYDTSMNETRCPITWDDFNEGECLMKIKHCGHYFKRANLMNWLRRENTCPVCRYDLRDYSSNNTNDIDLSNNNLNQTEPLTENNNPNEEDDTDDDMPELIDDNSRTHIVDNLSGIVREVLSNITNRESHNLYDTSSNIIAEYSFEFF